MSPRLPSPWAASPEELGPTLAEACRNGLETNPLELFDSLRGRMNLPMHGPAHHMLVAAVLVTAAINRGLSLPTDAIDLALRRSAELPGGSCGNWGCCGAAVAAGIAVSILLRATPLSGASRSRAQAVTALALKRIAELPAARCCLRESYLAMEVALASDAYPPGSPEVEARTPSCRQHGENPDCFGTGCPYHP